MIASDDRRGEPSPAASLAKAADHASTMRRLLRDTRRNQAASGSDTTASHLKQIATATSSSSMDQRLLWEEAILPSSAAPPLLPGDGNDEEGSHQPNHDDDDDNDGVSDAAALNSTGHRSARGGRGYPRSKTSGGGVPRRGVDSFAQIVYEPFSPTSSAALRELAAATVPVSDDISTDDTNADHYRLVICGVALPRQQASSDAEGSHYYSAEVPLQLKLFWRRWWAVSALLREEHRRLADATDPTIGAADALVRLLTQDDAALFRSLPRPPTDWDTLSDVGLRRSARAAHAIHSRLASLCGMSC